MSLSGALDTCTVVVADVVTVTGWPLAVLMTRVVPLAVRRCELPDGARHLGQFRPVALTDPAQQFTVVAAAGIPAGGEGRRAGVPVWIIHL
jgi:hypothetical protein